MNQKLKLIQFCVPEAQNMHEEKLSIHIPIIWRETILEVCVSLCHVHIHVYVHVFMCVCVCL